MVSISLRIRKGWVLSLSKTMSYKTLVSTFSSDETPVGVVGIADLLVDMRIAYQSPVMRFLQPSSAGLPPTVYGLTDTLFQGGSTVDDLARSFIRLPPDTVTLSTEAFSTFSRSTCQRLQNAERFIISSSPTGRARLWHKHCKQMPNGNNVDRVLRWNFVFSTKSNVASTLLLANIGLQLRLLSQ